MDLWPITIDARKSLLATFEELDADQWATRSLCSGWTIKELLAHLILATRPPARRYAIALARERGIFDRANHALACADAHRPVEALLSEYRAVIDRRFSPPGWPQAAPLSDIVLHTLDVRIPLDLDTARPREDYEPVLELVLSSVGRSFTQRRRPRLRWTATDHNWSAGDGALVSGTMENLALAAAGRSARLHRLEGDGAEQLTAWLGTDTAQP